VDGQEADLLCADAVLRGVYLPAGSHRVVFAYRPAGLAWGVALSLLGLGLALFLSLW
jgi:uncharacterized membrane protein YfhO